VNWAIIDPEPPITAVVELDDLLVMITCPLLVDSHDVKLNPGFAIAEIAIVAPELNHCDPKGFVEPCPSGVTENTIWY